MWKYFYILGLVATLFTGQSARGQRLIIETPSMGPFTRVIYGKVSEKSVFIFEKAYPFEVDETLAGGAAGDGQRPEVSTGVDGAMAPPVSTTGTSMVVFTLTSPEMVACVNSTRFKGFLELARALKTKVNSVKIVSGEDAGACAGKVRGAITSVLTEADVSMVTSDVDGVKVDLGVSTAAPGPDKSSPEIAKSMDAPPAQEATLEEILKKVKITAGEHGVIADAEGYFAVELEAMEQTEIIVTLPGRKPVRVSTFPVLVGSEPAPVTSASVYKSRSAEFSKPALRVVISETPFLVKKTTLDGGFGGGYGYGREVPGEKRGQRMVALLGLERREMIDHFGARASVFYTRAPESVVPQTYTFRSLAFYDWSLLDDDMIMRAGGGFEYFSAQVKFKKTARPSAVSSPSALIPQQVTAPLISWSIHTVLFNRLIVAPVIIYSPLYVPSVGFYPSLSPVLEFGVKVHKNWLLVAQAGSETHRFPSIAGETRLRMDFGLLTVKSGFF